MYCIDYYKSFSLLYRLFFFKCDEIIKTLRVNIYHNTIDKGLLNYFVLVNIFFFNNLIKPHFQRRSIYLSIFCLYRYSVVCKYTMGIITDLSKLQPSTKLTTVVKKGNLTLPIDVLINENYS